MIRSRRAWLIGGVVGTALGCGADVDERPQPLDPCANSCDIEQCGFDPGRVVAIDAGGSFTCALHERGVIQCWGAGDYGQIGHGSYPWVSRPRQVKDLCDAVAFNAGGCAIRGDGSLTCWGPTTIHLFGEYGDPTSVPVPVPLPGRVQTTWRDCVLLEASHELFCWGRIGADEDGHYTVYSPEPIALPQQSVRSLDHAAHSCAALEDGRAFCWGVNYLGQLGDGTKDWTIEPVQVVGLSEVRQVATVTDATCALHGSDGRVSCWGDATHV
jgi:alpha-tubulin suppressor-like RCC1 family protein